MFNNSIHLVKKDNTIQEGDVKDLKHQKNESKTVKTKGTPSPCPICGVIICNKYNLSCHIRRHNNDKPHKCDVCFKAFLLKQELERHKVVHSIDRPFKCKLCPKSYKKWCVLRVHMDTHGVNEYKCRYCDAVFKNRRVHGNHERNVHSDSKLKCRYCYKTFVENIYKEEHEENFHNKSFNANGIHSAKSKKDKLKKERKNVKGLSSDKNFQYYPCKVCPERFKYRVDQLAHYQTKHREEFDKVFKICLICGKILTIKHYTSHMQVHEGNMPYTCSQCEYKSARKEDLKAHSSVHVKESYFYCSKCQRPFRNKATALLCEKRHTGKKDLKCRDCDKTFFSNAELQSHEVAKHKLRKCSLCGYETFDRYLFSQHRKTHCNPHTKAVSSKSVKSRPMCDKCGSFFRSHFALMAHSRIHNDDDPASGVSSRRMKICSYCDYQGWSNLDILSHCRETHPTKVKRCELCSYSTLNINHFLGHIRHHSKNSSEVVFKSRQLKNINGRENGLFILECFICGFLSEGKEQMEMHFEKHKTTFKEFPWFSKGNQNISFTIKHTNSKYNKKCPGEFKEKPCSKNIGLELVKLEMKILSEPVEISSFKTSEDYEIAEEISENIFSEHFDKNVDSNNQIEHFTEDNIQENLFTPENSLVICESSKENNTSVFHRPRRKKRMAYNLPITRTTSAVINNSNKTQKISMKIKRFKKNKARNEDIKDLVNNCSKITSPKHKINNERIIALKTKLQNIDGKLFFPLEELHSLGTLSKEALLRVLRELH